MRSRSCATRAVGSSRHRIVFEGNPEFELTLQASADAEGRHPFLGIIWTALVAATAIPQVCEGRPGVLDHFDTGVVKPQGLVRDSAG